MNKAWRRVGIGIGAAVVIAQLPSCTRPPHATSEVHVFRTPAWSPWDMPGTEVALGELFMRKVDAHSPQLLLKHSATNAVYVFDPKGPALRQAKASQWEGASGEIGICEEQRVEWIGRVAVEIDREDVLKIDGRELTTRGRYLLDVSVSPEDSMVAVLSAVGPRVRSLLPFTVGSSNAHGQHYCEVFSLKLRKALAVTALPITTDKDAYVICWSPDSSLLVLGNMGFSNLCILQAPPSQAASPDEETSDVGI